MTNSFTIQIIGRKSCEDTRKAIRFFKERGIVPHFLDLKEKPLSRGELVNIVRALAAGGDKRATDGMGCTNGVVGLSAMGNVTGSMGDTAGGLSGSDGAEALVDRDSAAYKKGGYQYRVFDPAEELFENQDLLRTPIVRCGSSAIVGSNPAGWALLAGRIKS